MNDLLDDGKLVTIFCVYCGSKLGQTEPGQRCGFHCPKCREDFITTLKEGCLTLRKARMIKRQASVQA